MKNRFLSGLIIVAVLAFFSACSLLPAGGSDHEHFVVEVDSVEAPASIPAGDTLEIQLLGTIGPNGCYSLDHIESEKSRSTLELTVSGRHNTEATACTLAIVPLRKLLAVAPPYHDPFEIVIQQPDGSELRREVRIE